ncbi:MAG: hypothetical protein AMXMBFR57_10500 [Acidimicrobiia bacterium]
MPVRLPGQSRGPARALYCEPAPEPITPEVIGADGTRPGLFVRMKRSFQQALAEGEAERRRRERGEPELPGGSSVGRFIKRKLADSVAEHRLLWALRHEQSARLYHPLGMTAADAVSFARSECARDRNKHAFWAIVDALLFIASGLIAWVPGPNVLAYYLLFRAVSHYFSLVGGLHGARASMWTPMASQPLTALEEALALPADARAARVQDVAAALGLERLPLFLRRVTGA